MSKREVDISVVQHGTDIRKIAPGQTINVNHVGCPAGEDTRGRLYVTRKTLPNTLVVWYCHNCGEGGAGKWPVGKWTHLPKAVSTADKRKLVEDIWKQSLPLSEAPKHVLDWIETVGAGALNTLRYHPERDALVVAVRERYTTYSPHGAELLGVQLRSFGYGPKWMTVKCSADAGPLRTKFFPSQDERDPPVSRVNTVVIVEDHISAARIFIEHPAWLSYCLYGAHATMDELAHLIKEEHCTTFLVWLDNDNPQVERSRDEIARRLKLLGATQVRVVQDLQDPKYFDTEELRNMKYEDFPSV